jgi:hypothetical protein
MTAANSNCVILVLAVGPLAPKCEDGLRELEKRGYPIRRGRGFSAIDQGRNQMASEALHDGFDETMWIDLDVGFSADDVEKLRAHQLPIVTGLYPQPQARSLACELLPGTESVVFGEDGGLVEIKYAACGFLHVRREAYDAIREQLNLPLCNTRFGRGAWPFFQPMAVPEIHVQSGSETQPPAHRVRHRYLTDDFAFCHRARSAGLKIMADTTIRLWRIASYGFGWEDAGQDPERYDTFHYHVGPPPESGEREGGTP